MTSTDRHSSPAGRALLLAGALALTLVGLLSAGHAACAHVDHGRHDPGDPHQCAVCRHLANDVPDLLPAEPIVMVAADLLPDVDPTPAAGSREVSPAPSRAPPACDSSV